jgi:hypothetical protein
MMPKAKNPLSPEEQRKRFEEEVRKRKEAGDFDPAAADAALEAMIRSQQRSEKNPSKTHRD